MGLRGNAIKYFRANNVQNLSPGRWINSHTGTSRHCQSKRFIDKKMCKNAQKVLKSEKLSGQVDWILIIMMYH